MPAGRTIVRMASPVPRTIDQAATYRERYGFF
jgi:hypothetical protein